MNRVLKVLSNVAAGKLERSLKCEACGNDFSCGASLKGCWCSKINLSDQDRSSLRSQYNDCLCRECLERAATNSQRINERTVKEV